MAKAVGFLVEWEMTVSTKPYENVKPKIAVSYELEEGDNEFVESKDKSDELLKVMKQIYIDVTKKKNNK